MENAELEYQLSRFEEWVKNADTKIGVLLTFDGVFLVIFLKVFLTQTFSPNTNGFELIGYIIALVLFLWSMIKALLGIMPRLSHGQGRHSLFHFIDVGELSVAEYKKQLSKLKPADYPQELAGQMHALARIATKKMTCFRDSVILLIASLTIIGGLVFWQHLTNSSIK